ncbi:hypothetical protein CWI42_121840 [Ordospora colligata]|uniref:PCI domain-containing protein n=1 Tax=Ordospora colligata OC4 TaxID=1354746 RepID=A0A0B2UD18_9MICR|nr:uncharacterized protein M896_121840 [Ordospora colligata OC4]KHN68961.1 hypothetical protein M896_121840 [Ordospora colligata OC4]TBU13995.1 hypothetical protein CWI40_121840 [Ordospora colligata]TBU14184.1 hypothetical protein CWI41_121840 [Ordospora colligata]TBU17853.1 hypothetical protein CWI42_121840 [Ordospora colligata]
MGLEEIHELQRQRKWMQFCRLIMDSVDKISTEMLLGVFLESVNLIHPRTLCEVFLVLAAKLPPRDGVDLLNKGQETISSCVLYSEDFEAEKAMMEMKKCLLLIGMNEFKGIETRLFEWRRMKMTKDMQAMYNFVGFKLYQGIGNIEASFSHLLKYVKLTNASGLTDTLVEYGMLSKDFFNFTAITSLPCFSNIKSNDLREMFVLFREGNIDELEMMNKKLVEKFGTNSELVKEKMYMIALTNLCFAEREKKIPIRKIEEVLKIPRKVAIYIIMKSLGLKLICGWINGEEDALYFDSLAPRTLQPKEIMEIQGKLGRWRRRIHEVISMLK